MADIDVTETKVLGDPAIITRYTPTTDVALTASGGAMPSAQSTVIDVRGSEAILFTVDHDLAGSNSTDLDAVVYTSYDGTRFDTEVYASLNLGVGQVKSVPLTPGPAYLRWVVMNNDAGNATSVRPVITITR